MPGSTVQVVLDLPIPRAFTYLLPPEMEGSAGEGKRVKVPFGKREAVGLCVGRDLSDGRGFTLKPVLAVLDEEPLLPPPLVELARWIAAHYGASLGETVFAFLPGRLKQKRKPPRPRLERKLGEIAGPDRESELTGEQGEAFAAIAAALGEERTASFLLYGVTGSGKTEVYFAAIARALAQGRSALLLVPEISLTPQTYARFSGHFPGVSLWHSKMTVAQREEEWWRIRNGERNLVIGPRSALFAPVPRLGIIIMDEEHDGSFKQSNAPRYQARTAAAKRAGLEGAVLVLGSATPSQESYEAAGRGELQLLQLRERYGGTPLPEVKIVDLNAEIKERKSWVIVSRPLEEAMQETLEQGEQVLLFLNRRGFATFIHCKHCQEILRCPTCQVALVYHLREKKILCHYCDYRSLPPETCPVCRFQGMLYHGTGTERVAAWAQERFPGRQVIRMDSDTMKREEDYLEVYRAFARGEGEILVGTQMVVKGHDFPRLSLVGVIAADASLNFPDFRGAERTFQLITQVAGRSGRREKRGLVLVQSFNPDHFVLKCASRHDYQAFAAQESLHRQETGYPPFAHLMRIILSSPEEPLLDKETAQWEARLAGLEAVSVLGPAVCPIPVVRGWHRRHFLLKIPLELPLPEIISRLQPFLAIRPKLRAILDVDPGQML